MSGYTSSEYAHSLKSFGRPLHLVKSGSWVLERRINQTHFTDVMGCYPIMSCKDWFGLEHDLHMIQDDQVSFTAVIDPLGLYEVSTLEALFGDLCKPFKRHFVVELDEDYASKISTNHARNARKSLKCLDIRREKNPLEVLEEWIALYGELIKRHSIKGIASFSPDSFSVQFNTPGLIVYTARHEDVIVGMVLFFAVHKHVYYHLAAYSPDGYHQKASFGIFRRAIDDFKQEQYEVLNLGGVAGLSDNEEDGLTRFKKGWSTHTRTAYLCGKVFNPQAYESLSRGKETAGFFPAYRTPR